MKVEDELTNEQEEHSKWIDSITVTPMEFFKWVEEERKKEAKNGEVGQSN